MNQLASASAPASLKAVRIVPIATTSQATPFQSIGCSSLDFVSATP